MSMECGECEGDLRGGHAPDCSRRPRWDVTPWLLVKCEHCSEEHNCHPPDEMRWSRRTPGAAPEPVCEGCWDGGPGDHETDWFDLPEIHLPERLPA